MTSDILCEVDRDSLLTSLESRMPFLDSEVAHFVWSLPLSTKLHGGVSKWPLRQVLKRYLPEKLFVRPKIGFGIPIGDWLRGPLHDWAEEMLSEQRLKEGGYFKTEVIRQVWAEHVSGRHNLQHSLWGVLMFEAWRKEWM